MTEQEILNLSTVRKYLCALASGAVGEELARYFTPDAVQIEFPNRLNPDGGRSNLATLLERAERGRAILQSQQYHVLSTVAQGHDVAIETEWSGVLAVAVGALAAGDTMRAHIAVFFRMRDGRIAEQRNYDCFQPW